MADLMMLTLTLSLSAMRAVKVERSFGSYSIVLKSELAIIRLLGRFVSFLEHFTEFGHYMVPIGYLISYIRWSFIKLKHFDSTKFVS